VMSANEAQPETATRATNEAIAARCLLFMA
jgi:hypothetical protein